VVAITSLDVDCPVALWAKASLPTARLNAVEASSTESPFEPRKGRDGMVSKTDEVSRFMYSTPKSISPV
jgi:hypothetical protein